MFFSKEIKATPWVEDALRSSRYEADYSVDSLKEIDRYLLQ